MTSCFEERKVHTSIRVLGLIADSRAFMSIFHSLPETVVDSFPGGGCRGTKRGVPPAK